MNIWNRPTRLRYIAFCLYTLASFILLLFVGQKFMHLSGFAIREVNIMGDIHYISQAQVVSVIQKSARGSFFAINVADVRSALKGLPWVRNVIVKRRWPATLDIYFEEHHPVARWTAGGFVNSEGEIFQAAAEKNLNDLPVWSAPVGSEKELMRGQEMIEKYLSPLDLHVRGIDLSPRHAWVFLLDHGVKVFVGRDNVEDRLRRFAWAHRNVLHTRFRQLEYVDLRYNSGFVIKQH